MVLYSGCCCSHQKWTVEIFRPFYLFCIVRFYRLWQAPRKSCSAAVKEAVAVVVVVVALQFHVAAAASVAIVAEGVRIPSG